MKKKRILTGAFLVLVILSTLVYLGIDSKLRELEKEISQIKIQEMDLSEIADGIYIGEYAMNDFLGAKVEIEVKNNRIIDIHLIEHKHGKGKKGEEIVQRVLNSQQLQVDTISGATGSSKVILKAIEQGLIQ
ncbi:MAG: FMN-binding protein [Thermotaleaceae bacterium]